MVWIQSQKRKGWIFWKIELSSTLDKPCGPAHNYSSHNAYLHFCCLHPPHPTPSPPGPSSHQWPHQRLSPAILPAVSQPLCQNQLPTPRPLILFSPGAPEDHWGHWGRAASSEVCTPVRQLRVRWTRWTRQSNSRFFQIQSVLWDEGMIPWHFTPYICGVSFFYFHVCFFCSPILLFSVTIRAGVHQRFG